MVRAVCTRYVSPDGAAIERHWQDKRSVVAIELEDVDRWLHAPAAEAALLIRPPAPASIVDGPAPPAA